MRKGVKPKDVRKAYRAYKETTPRKQWMPFSLFEKRYLERITRENCHAEVLCDLPGGY